MVKSIYIGSSLPMTLKAVENYKKDKNNGHKIISVSGLDVDLLSNIIWSGLEHDLINHWVEKNFAKKINVNLQNLLISIDGQKVMFTSDGLKNINELYRKIINKKKPESVTASNNHRIKKNIFNYLFHNQFPDLMHFFSDKNLVNILGESLSSTIFDVKSDLVSLKKNNTLNGISVLFFSRGLGVKFKDEELNLIIVKLICGLGIFDPSNIVYLLNSKNLYIQKTRELKILPYSEGFGIIRTSGYDRDVVVNENSVYIEENF